MKNNSLKIIISIFALVLLAAFIGISVRVRESIKLKEQTKINAITMVRVITPKKGAEKEEIILPGDVMPWHEASIYARTSGYIKNWTVEIGDKVTAGQILAEIDTPEIDAQLRQAEADLKIAEANNSLAQVTVKRWKALATTGSVAKQDIDQKIADALAKNAQLASSKANRDKLFQLQSFKYVTAPFDGIITSRNIDKGALVNAGSMPANSKELFHIIDASKLRIYVNVPQNYAENINTNLEAKLYFPNKASKTYLAKLVSSSEALNSITRTLLVQFEVDNARSELLSGGYVQVHMKLPSNNNILRLPVNSIMFRGQGVEVAKINEQERTVIVPVVIGRDFGNELEIKSGISLADKIVINPPDSLINGQLVKVISNN